MPVVFFISCLKQKQKEASISRAKAGLRTIETALEAYYLEFHHYPDALEKIRQFREYRSLDLHDPFRPAHYFTYKKIRQGQSWICYSVGPNGLDEWGEEDDIAITSSRPP